MKKTRQQLREQRTASLAIMALALIAVWISAPFGAVVVTAFFASITLYAGVSAGYAQFKLRTFTHDDTGYQRFAAHLTKAYIDSFGDSDQVKKSVDVQWALLTQGVRDARISDMAIHAWAAAGCRW